MMVIIIQYDSCWRNSFLDGEDKDYKNNKKRKFIASSQGLKDSKNFKEQGINKDTIMGVLNRLIGEQRKLYKAREHPDYYFKEIDTAKNLQKLKFKDNIKVKQQEVVYLKNINGHKIAGNANGEAKSGHELFNSSYSKDLWSIWAYEFEDLIKFILDENYKNPIQEFDFRLDNIKKHLNNTKKVKIEDLKLDEKDKQYLKKEILDFQILREDKKNKKKELQEKLEESHNNYECRKFTFYSYAFHRKIKKEDLYKNKKIAGISANSYTSKDFIKSYFDTPQKITYGNPYKSDKFSDVSLTKATGKLIIELDISKEEAQNLRQKIWDAGVLSFYLGKKGVAYVKDIIIKN